MLVWINGSFGGGKTQTAHELQRRLPGSVICDPEEVGFGLHRMTPRHLRGDFQDLPAWREGVFEVLDLTLAASVCPVIVPMTLVEPTYYAETIGRLRERGHEVHHFALLAERATVLRRLRERSLGRALQVVVGRDTPTAPSGGGRAGPGSGQPTSASSEDGQQRRDGDLCRFGTTPTIVSAPI